MTVVLNPGLQTTVQASPRTGMRHFGVPSSGPADPLSMALANRLLGNALDCPSLELTLGNVQIGFEEHTLFAVTGALAPIAINGEPVAMHQVLAAKPGDEIEIGDLQSGARNYLSLSGGIAVAPVLGSASTYLPAGLGGHEGRQLRAGDRIASAPLTGETQEEQTPARFQPRYDGVRMLRACGLASAADDKLFEQRCWVSPRADRMGLQLECELDDVADDGRQASIPVFPGTVQCPADGQPYLMSVDAQTTGGYTQLAQVCRVDRHLIGQLKPGDNLQFLYREPDDAVREYRDMLAYWSEWLGPEINRLL